MMVQANQEEGADSATPTDSHSTPIISQPSSTKPQKKKSGRKQRKDSAPAEPTTKETLDEAHVSTPSYDPPQSEKTKEFRKEKEVKNTKEDASKQGRKITNLDADAEVTLVDETQEMNDDNLMFDTDVLEEQEKDVAKKEVSASDPITTGGEVVTTANVEVTTINAPTTTIDELLHLLLQQLELQDPRLEGL
ncbi:hypothetical protein Tco_1573014 [Tanacetum coccineum]